MCDKRSFGSKGAARNSVKNMHETIRVYWCKDCKGYHTTQDRYAKVGNSQSWNARARKKIRNRKR